MHDTPFLFPGLQRRPWDVLKSSPDSETRHCDLYDDTERPRTHGPTSLFRSATGPEEWTNRYLILRPTVVICIRVDSVLCFLTEVKNKSLPSFLSTEGESVSTDGSWNLLLE